MKRPILAALVMIALTSCAGKGLLTESHSPDLYEGVMHITPGPHPANPVFLAGGDSQSGWRAKEKLLRSENWWTPKAFIFPFYYIYNIGQGLVGTVNWVRHSPDWGGKERRLLRDALYDQVGRLHPDFFLHLGDICMSDGRRPDHWADYLRESKQDVPLLSSVPVVPVIGNHERANDERYGYPNFRAVFDYPRFYVMDFPDLALFVVDANFLVDQKQHIDDEEQDRLFEEWFAAADGSAWLQRELAARNQRFKVVAMHHPPVSFGRHYDDWLRDDYGTDLSRKRRRFLDVLFDGGVQMVLAGHEHIYQHTTVRRIRDGEPAGDTIDIVVTSGIGAPIRALWNEDHVEEARAAYRAQGLAVDLVEQRGVHHFSVARVTPDALTVDTYAVHEESAHPYPLIENIRVGGPGGHPVP